MVIFLIILQKSGINKDDSFLYVFMNQAEENHVVREEAFLNKAEGQDYPEEKLAFLFAVTVVAASIAKSSCMPAV